MKPARRSACSTDDDKDPAVVLGDLLAQELGKNTPMTDDDWESSLYLDVAAPQEIEKFLESSGEYENGRWVRLPGAPRIASELNEPLCKLINSILEHLLPSNGSTSRVAVDTHAHHFQAENIQGTHRRCSPDIVVKASGPSFLCPKGSSLGFSNIATCFDTRLDDEAEDYTRHLAYSTAYAKYMFVHQPNRFFSRSLVITENRANLFHFDRSGAQYSPLFDIHDKPRTFIRLILGLCAIDERILGLDDTVQWSVGADGKRKRGTVKTFDPDQSIVWYDLVMDEQPFVRTSLRGRGTICWAATNAKGEHFIIKDYWVSGGQTTEFGLLEEVKGLRGICQMVSHEPSRAQTTDFRGNTDRFEQSAFRKRTATRIVMKAYGPTIENFSSVEQVLAALRDAIAAHKLLLSKNILHRDISPNNILLGVPGSDDGELGILIDLDLALRIHQLGAQHRADPKIGTRMFQSMMVLRTAEMKEKEISAHDYLDDLEAFFWVFSYLVCFYRADGTPAPKSIFQAHPQSWLKANPVEAHRRKLCFLSLRGIVCEAKLYMDDGWRFACTDLFFKFREYMWKLADRKEELAFEDIEGEPDESGPNKFASMLKDVDEHYDHILGLFDEALEKTREAAKATSFLPKSATQSESSSLPVSQTVHVSVAAPANEPPISPQRRATSPSSTNDQPTVVTPSPSTPSDPATLIVTSTSSRGSKRRSHEAELEDSPTQVKRQRPPSRRLLKATH
ncbi:hypothetical protein EST38_g6200 [Candolleomyces aberdarensis]|uniref:Fungal-type protein kinase domain-containing protein n=1 Tax=Candolleomyces aberdarensis TaxID=2316362 RepID=A0A4Q2DIM5_9AGAR|nr:hypothetical protein EST38_g6200 [Candolleomyces aberdarensis]